jgi:hypothetical protein
MNKKDQDNLAKLYLEDVNNNNKMEYIDFLKSLQNEDFVINQNRMTGTLSAEYYKWNQWTVQVRTEDYNTFIIDLYFDNESLSHKDQTFKFNNVNDLKNTLNKVMKKMGVELESEMYM